jgi:hypothetical protein
MSRFQIAGRALLTAAVSASLAGCITSDTLIKVRADGGGTVEQTILVNPKTFEGFASLAGQMAGAEGKVTPGSMPSPGELLDEAKLKEAAARMGGGARYVSSTPMKRGDMEGARAIFAFDDINALVVDESPEGGGSKTPMTFKLNRGPSGSVLTITTREPEDRPAAQPAGVDSQPVPAEAMALLKPFFDGLHFAVAIDVEGSLVKTNADYVSGNRVTLLDVDFGSLLANPAAFEKLSSLGPGASLAEARPLLKDLPGVKVNTTPTVTIEFR